MKRLRKKTWLGIATVAILIYIGVLIGLAETTEEPKRAVLIVKSLSESFEFWPIVQQGAELACGEESIILEVKGTDLEKDVHGQYSILEETIEEEPDIILLAATDTRKLNPLIEEAINKKITLLTLDSKVEGIEGVKHVGTDNKEAAKALTRYMAGLIEEQGEVIMVSTVIGTGTAQERKSGYEEELKSYPNIKMHNTVYSGGTIEGTYKLTKELIERYPNLTVILGANQQTTDGICQAVQEFKGDRDIKVVGFDGSDTIVRAMEKGIIDAIIVQKPFNMGYIAVKNAVALFQGKDVDAFTNTEYKFITSDTLYLVENQKLLYPIIQ